jgi:hypothetical protein
MDTHERKGAVVVSYAVNSTTEEPFLHLWNGQGWVRIFPEQFMDGSFLRNRPAQVWIVGPDAPLTTALIEQSVSWCPEVLNLSPASVTELINMLGRQFPFSSADWRWFSARYDLQLEDLREQQPARSWYDENRASELPPSVKPWKKPDTEPGALPSTSLSPIPLAEEPVQDVPEEQGAGEMFEVKAPSEGEAASAAGSEYP